MFSDILLTVDFDRTLTGPDSAIPERNIKAIRWFMENGGIFTVNTGRSTNTLRNYLDVIPVNAPFLLYNGSAAYEKGNLKWLRPIDLDLWETIRKVQKLFPELNLEIQGVMNHYLVDAKPEYEAFYDAMDWLHQPADPGQDMGPFIKFALFGKTPGKTMAHMFTGTPEELAQMDRAEETLRNLFGDKVEVFRAAPRIIDVHAKGVSKLQAARNLQEKLGRKILVCVGDAENDLTMLEGADYAFCPADGVVAERFPNVCPCGEGAVAEVIYKKIPEILGLSLDIVEKIC